MNELLSQITAGIISVFISIHGFWTESIFVVDDAAVLTASSINITDNITASSSGYVSLVDVLSEALNEIRDVVKNSTSTNTTPSPETSVKPTNASPSLSDAIVNIYCVQKTRDYKRTTSGTGFFINDQGVILTNAHVGQFLLLEKTDEFGEIDCFVRSGHEAETAYEVSLLYVSPTWILDNAEIITTNKPQGTGENDFALLYITSSLNSNPLPDKFAYIPPATSPLTRDFEGQPVVLVGYPSKEKISGKRVVATTTITDLYTFESGYADIFSVSASPLGHQGSSGGPVIDALGRAIGVVTTKDGKSTILNAITLAHIDRQIKHETGYDLISIINSDAQRRTQLFNDTLFPILQSILTAKLK